MTPADQHTQGVPDTVITRDGRKLHTMVLAGPQQPGTPTVVFEAGAAAARHSWALVQIALASSVRTVVYDRSGLGRSAADPAARTLARMADDLNDVLDHVAPGPFILVGHSAGGPIVRLAAANRPARIAGIVLVDPTDEAADVLFSKRFRRLERIAIAVGTAFAGAGLLRFAFRKLLRDVPADVARDMRNEAFTPTVVRTQRQQARTFLDDLAAWRSDPPDLRSIPVTAISGALAGEGMNADIRAEANAAHARRVAESPRGRHVLAERSGHNIPFTEPEVIAEVIRDLIDGAYAMACRRRSRAGGAR